MVRRFALLATLMAFAAAPRSAAAQQNPLAAPDVRFNGTWTLDRAGSDPLPEFGSTARPAGDDQGSRAGAGAGADAGTGAGGVAAGSGGSGGRGGGRGMSRAGGGGGGRGGMGSASGDPAAVADLMAEIAPETIRFEVSEGKAVITNGLHDAMEWQTDKKTRQIALAKGGTIDVEASWWTRTLQTIRTITKDTELKKDMKLVEDGKAMEVKVTAKLGGKKSELKLRYVKAD